MLRLKSCLWAALTSLSALAFCPTPANAQDIPPAQELRYNLAVDASVAGGGTLLWILGETVGKNAFAPLSCHWCEPPGIDASARSLRWDNPHSAQVIGSITASVGAPLSAFGLTWLAAAHDGRGSEEWVNAMLIVEAVATTMLINDIFKWTFGRQRPAVHYQAGNWESFPENDRNLSFFSAHSSLSFSFAVASGTIATMRGYRWAPLVWAVGLPMAAFTAYSRIAGDAHYFTDVLTGSLVGAAVGFAIPFFFHNRVAAPPQAMTLMPYFAGNSFGLSGTF